MQIIVQIFTISTLAHLHISKLSLPCSHGIHRFRIQVTTGQVPDLFRCRGFDGVDDFVEIANLQLGFVEGGETLGTGKGAVEIFQHPSQ